MGAPTEVYVDPSLASDTGSGTLGDPYGDLQHALDSVTRDATNGNRFNIKAGTDEILTAAIDLSTYGAPDNGHPLVFQGYTSAAGDGGVGGISGGGSVAVIASSTNYVSFVDLHCHNTGSAYVLSLGALGAYVVRCEIENSTGGGINSCTGAFECNIHDISGIGINVASSDEGVILYGNYLKNGSTNKFTTAIFLDDTSIVARNIISIDGASIGIDLDKFLTNVFSNSVLSSSGTGIGITISGTVNVASSLYSNLVEGFSGSGGIGIQITEDTYLYTGNAVFNCTTNYSVTGDPIINLGDNETLSASPFAKSGSDTFANRFTYFAPVDTGNVFGGAYQ